jgi:hypothetical protein
MSKLINQSFNIYQPNGRFANNLNHLEQKRLYFSNVPAGVVIQRGKKKVRSNIPPGMIIVKDFLNKNQCKQLKDYASSEVGVPHVVGGLDKDGNHISIVSEDRITDYIAIDGVLEPIKEIYQRAFKTIMDPHYGIQTEWYTTPSILRYGIGGKYVEHSDSENWNDQEKKWFKQADRDFSQLLYLNNDYTGGTLYFLNFDFRFQPKAGMLVSFPSDHRYLHQAETVESGTRYAIVSWAVAKNSRRILAERPS